jgi:glyoxylase-like metal-dependent hydrolase (beta-lactamase superfamily II)
MGNQRDTETNIMHRLTTAVALVAGLFWTAAAHAQATIEKMYVLDCGQGRAADQSRWSPGVNVGKPLDVSDNCYLIRHARGWMMWDTGIPEAVATMPDGLVSGGGAMVWKRPKTIASQLEQIGVKPADVRYVGISHTHGDHIGNVDMFAAATVLIQGAEYDWAFGQANPPFSKEHAVRKLAGDLDVFGDGSVRIVSTPGHTPGHQSLIVRMAKTGTVILSGDAAHFRDNWENRRVPSMNVDKDKTLASLQRIADLLAENKAELWINHDKAQSDAYRRPPQYYD